MVTVSPATVVDDEMWMMRWRRMMRMVRMVRMVRMLPIVSVRRRWSIVVPTIVSSLLWHWWSTVSSDSPTTAVLIGGIGTQ